MKALIEKYLNKDDKLLKHSLVMFVGGTVVNVLNYVYQLVMGRILGPAEFGVLGAIFALIYIATFSFGAIKTVVMKFAADYSGKKQLGKVKALLTGGLSRFALISVAFFVVYFFIAPFIARFLKIPEASLLLWAGLFLVITLVGQVPQGIMNGLQKFVPMAFVSVFGSILKLVLSAGLVLLGYGVFGAIIALNIAQAFVVVLSLLFLVGIFKVKKTAIEKTPLLAYSVPVLFGLTFMHFFVNVDILLVKHFFSDVEAGNYAAASVLGKIVLFSSGALMTVMFPKVSFSKSAGKNASKLLKNTLFYTAVISGCVVLLYFFIPTFISNVLFGSAFDIASLIGLMGLALCLFSVSNVLVNYNLAIHRTGFVYGLLPLLALEIGAIWLFHGTLFEVVQVLFVTNVLILGFLLLYTRNAFGVDAS